MKNTHHRPIFSVVMPMYNVEKYVEQAIDSVLSQSYPDFELICVNDGCTDRTVDIVKEFDDARISLVSQDNMGLSAARNTGINNSKGKFVALLDSDDYWHPDKLLNHLLHLKKAPGVGVSYSASVFIDEDGEELGVSQNPKLKNVSSVDVFCRNPVGNGSAAVIRREVFDQVSEVSTLSGSERTCYFDESMRQSEDIDFWVRVALLTSWRFEGIRSGLTYYRVNTSGLSANLSNQYNAWKYSVNKNRNLNTDFFESWFSLASAYQKRYLARRAIQSRNSVCAIKLIFSGLLEDPRMLWHEPARTGVSLLCAFLSCLPEVCYNPIEKFGMFLNSKRLKII